MSKRSANLLVEDILESANKIQKYTKGMSFEKFVKVTKPLMRSFETLRSSAKPPADCLRNLKLLIIILTGLGSMDFETGSFTIISELLIR